MLFKTSCGIFFTILYFQNEKDSFTVVLKPFTELVQIISTNLLEMSEGGVFTALKNVTASGK
jgi:hypothetical protein